MLARLNDSDKLWKFNPRDVDERERWDDYQAAFQDAIANTDADHAPWYVVPADDKWTMQAIVASVIAHTLDALPLSFPVPREEDMASFEKARLMLEANANSSDPQTGDRNNADEDPDADDDERIKLEPVSFPGPSVQLFQHTDWPLPIKPRLRRGISNYPGIPERSRQHQDRLVVIRITCH